MPVSFRTLMAKIRGLRGQREARTELDDEIQLHIQMLTDRFVRQGMSPNEARSAAQRQFGNADLLRDRQHQQRAIFSLVSIWRDLRFGLR